MAGRLVKSANSAAVPVMSTTAPYLLRSPCTQKITNTHSDIRKPPIDCLSGKERKGNIVAESEAEAKNKLKMDGNMVISQIGRASCRERV